MAETTNKKAAPAKPKKAKPPLARREARIVIAYDAVRETEIAKFNAACMDKTAKGWQPQGGISTAWHAGVTLYAQAFVLYADQVA